MNENEFHALADKTLDHLSECLEYNDAAGELEVENESGIVTITLKLGKQFIVSKHAPTRQLWLSSPVSGGLHFYYENGWKLGDSRELFAVLAAEISDLAQIKVEF